MGKDRKNIAVIMDTMDGVYQSRISNSLIEYGENKNFNLIFYSGMASNSQNNIMSEHNAVFQLFNKNKFDGLIYVHSSLEIYVGKKGIKRLAKMCGELPTISLSVSIDGAKSIIIDNFDSMYKMTQHVLTNHDYKRIAFISGPLKNNEAVSRYNGFKSAIDVAQKPFNNHYFFEGDFLPNSGMSAIDYFAKTPLEMPDVIIAANDEMAIGALMRLKELGFDIPSEVAITGFDNIETSKSFFPSITTVNQPSINMSKHAIEYMDQLLHGESDLVPNEKYVSGELIIRESCGCFSIVDSIYSNKRNMDISTIEEDESPQAFPLSAYKEDIVNILIEFINPGTKHQEKFDTYFRELIDGLNRDIQLFEIEGDFLRVYSKIVNYAIVHTQLHCDWHKLMMNLRSYLYGIITNIQVISFLDDLFIQVALINGSNLSRKESLEHFLFKKMYIKSRTV
ncbi:MAG: substrate-binding domain-containing protein, partial [Vallitaleaceae bacterium]|nr:substrate-binding domain-containing protein [Vallitaleaceae bacterium]